jgi:putative membrane protein
MSFLIRLLINSVALWVATTFVSGVSFNGPPELLLLVALIFGILNTVLKPVLMILSLPALLLTLGLFTFVLNAFLLWLTGRLSDSLGLGFHVTGFGPAFVGALVVSFISVVLSLFVRPAKVEAR